MHDVWLMSIFHQEPGYGPSVAAVVSTSTCNEDHGGLLLVSKHGAGQSGRTSGGVLHQFQSRHSMFLHRFGIDPSKGCTGEDEAHADRVQRVTRGSKPAYTARSMSVLPILAWFLLVIAVLATVYWLIVLVRVRRIASTRPTVLCGLDSPEPDGGWPSVSVIIPAHNEERVIERCVRSILDQDYPCLEAIVVLDRCTDRTLEILQSIASGDDRLLLIENDDCPPDWAGKCNAAKIGSSRAGGDMLLFVDADTHAHRDVVRAAVGLARERGLDLLSLLSTLTCNSAYERNSQPVASMTLMSLYPMDIINRPSQKRSFANGQFMLFERERYESIGGHDAVKEVLLEDIAFARCVNRAGGRIHILNADGMFNCSMYSTPEAFRNGWMRIFIEGCRRKPARMRKIAFRVLFTGCILPLARVLAVGTGVATFLLSTQLVGLMAMSAGFLCLLMQFGTLAEIHRMGRQPICSVWRHPLGAVVVSGILRRAAEVISSGTPVVWAGKTYILEPR